MGRGEECLCDRGRDVLFASFRVASCEFVSTPFFSVTIESFMGLLKFCHTVLVV